LTDLFFHDNLITYDNCKVSRRFYASHHGGGETDSAQICKDS